MTLRHAGICLALLGAAAPLALVTHAQQPRRPEVEAEDVAPRQSRDQTEVPSQQRASVAEKEETVLHTTRVRLYSNYPAGTTLEQARRLFEESEARSVGDRSAHCDCPNLEPSGTQVSTRLLGRGTLRDAGSAVPEGVRVSFGVEVLLECACAPGDPAGSSDYETYKRGLRRLKQGCVAGRERHCQAFEAHLAAFSAECAERFAAIEECPGQAALFEGLPREARVALSRRTARKHVTFRMPCSGGPLRTCAACVQFQMVLSGSVEFVGREQCKQEGLPSLVSLRNASCAGGSGGPVPVYEAGCAP